MKYKTWQVSSTGGGATALTKAGINPLAAEILAARGYTTPAAAKEFLSSGQGELNDPLLLPDMAAARDRVRLALTRKEKIAVYGDYDVDGITSTCLVTDYLRSRGADCVWYIPGRLDEGYGLHPEAIEALFREGVQLIITVDCGITATEEAKLCKDLGIDLLITDHHECLPTLPEAVAAVDPYRPDSEYPFRDLAGVGVAFQLIAAVDGDQDAISARYADLAALGTIADVMPLTGENRILVSRGIDAIRRRPRVGLRALIAAAGLRPEQVSSTSVSFTLSPRINAAGRMGHAEIAEQLFLSDDPAEAAALADELCQLNYQRRSYESEILAEAEDMLSGEEAPDAIVLAGENWHPGVIGIVASRLSEEYACPVFLICLGETPCRGSSRSSGGFSLFEALSSVQNLLETFGGHEQAAGFSILPENIPAFREAVTAISRAWRQTHETGAKLIIDCAVDPALLTLPNIEALTALEPYGSGFPQPVLYIPQALVTRLTPIGGGRHLKLWLQAEGKNLECVFFSTTAEKADLMPGDEIAAAFTPQINEFRGVRSVQLLLTDVRPAAAAEAAIEKDKSAYLYLRGRSPQADIPEDLIPSRDEFALVWRYLSASCRGGVMEDSFSMLARKISRSGRVSASGLHIRIALDVFAERGLLSLTEESGQMHIQLTPGRKKVNLEESAVIRRLTDMKGGNS